MRLPALAVTVASCVPCLCATSLAQWDTDSLSEARGELGATSVGTLALFAGGRNPGGSSVVDVFDSVTGMWSTSNLSQTPWYVSGAGAGDLAMFTGLGSVVDIFDRSTGSWATAPIYYSGLARAATSTPSKILFAGGIESGSALDEVRIYDLGAGTWSSDFLSEARFGLAATSVGDLVLFGGGNISHTANIFVSTVDMLDTTTNTWSLANLSLPRSSPSATSVDGKVLFAGGWNFGPSDRVDIYDSVTGAWSQASLSEARASLSATTVGPFALFAGGYTGAPSDRVDIYDARSGSWSTARLSEARYGLAATTVGSRALFGGGLRASNSFSAVVDVFDVDLGTMYCLPTAPNSTGLPSVLRAEGVLTVALDDLTLFAEQLPPGQFGYFITGLTQGFIQPPGSQGPICLSGNIGRYNRSVEIIQGPVGSLQLDLTSMPVNPPLAALPGDTWNFQCWYRDINPTPTSNTTNALAVTFATTGVPSVQFAVTQASVVEDTTLLEVRITLSQPTDQDVLVTYAAGGTATIDVDWRVEEPNPFVIPAGQTRADMTLVIAEDGAQEPDEVAIVSFGAPVGAVLGTQTTFTLTIVDDD